MGRGRKGVFTGKLGVCLVHAPADESEREVLSATKA